MADQQTLLEIKRANDEHTRLVLEIEARTAENKDRPLTHVVLPSFLAGAAIVVACAHVAKLFIAP